ncbi:50S ribosomal protein L10 [Candidatus Uhrbacteria bacterium]|nr:50S ribosomal protein L10 [Candidatus Uhrbacteria bacterium]
MAKTKVQKQATVTGIADRLQRMAGAVFTDFAGLKVAELEELRRNARAANCEYLVVKKSLFRRAASDRGIGADAVGATGNLSVLFGFSDAVAPAKIAKQFAKAHAAFKVLSGLIREELGIRPLAGVEVITLGDLPSREELIARAVGSIAAPLRGMVGVLQGNLRNLVGVLNALQQQRSH